MKWKIVEWVVAGASLLFACGIVYSQVIETRKVADANEAQIRTHSERVTVVETHLIHMRGDLKEIKTTLNEIRDRK